MPKAWGPIDFCIIILRPQNGGHAQPQLTITTFISSCVKLVYSIVIDAASLEYTEQYICIHSIDGTTYVQYN